MSRLYGKYIKKLSALPNKQTELNTLKNNYNISPNLIKLLSSFDGSGFLCDTYNKVYGERNDKIKELEKELAEIPKQSFDLACRLEEKGQHEKAIALITRLEKYSNGLGNFDEIKTQVSTAVKSQILRRRLLTICGFILFASIFLITLFSYIIPQHKYTKALDLIADKKYEQAYAMLNEIYDFKDSKEQLLISKYTQAMELQKSCNYDEAIAIFTEINNYKNAKDMINKTLYLKATDLVNSKKYYDACLIFKSLKNYTGAFLKFSESKLALLKYADIGDIVLLGSIEQDNNILNGKEDIEWIVLDKNKSKLLLTSRVSIDRQRYTPIMLFNNQYDEVSWKSSGIRKWLNNDFLDNTFSSVEKVSIQSTSISNEIIGRYPYGDSNTPLSDTSDYIFLLSYSEAEKYLTTEDNRICKETEYVKENAEFGADDCYWLRTTCTGIGARIGCFVYSNGDISFTNPYNTKTNLFCVSDPLGVRPAMWVDISKINIEG